MNIEQQWQNATEEFCDCAFERFFVNYGEDSFTPISNNHAFEHLNALQLIPNYELFQHDVSVYGDDAYQMIEISLSDKNRFIDAIDNRDVEWALNSTNYDVRRKNSAALLFDLERAKAGDVVELEFKFNEWEAGRITEYLEQDDTDVKVKIDFHQVTWIDKSRLRMKHPPKINR